MKAEGLNAEKNQLESFILHPSFRLVALLSLAFAGTASAASAEGSAQTFLLIAIILIAARVAALVERFGQSAVLGELIVGVLLGNLSLVEIQFLEPIIADPILDFLAQLGVVILLFQVGLESDLESMRRVGARAFFVTLIGVVVPFVLGAYVVDPWLLPESSKLAHLFLGAISRRIVSLTTHRSIGTLPPAEKSV